MMIKKICTILIAMGLIQSCFLDGEEPEEISLISSSSIIINDRLSKTTPSSSNLIQSSLELSSSQTSSSSFLEMSSSLYSSSSQTTVDDSTNNTRKIVTIIEKESYDILTISDSTIHVQENKWGCEEGQPVIVEDARTTVFNYNLSSFLLLYESHECTQSIYLGNPQSLIGTWEYSGKGFANNNHTPFYNSGACDSTLTSLENTSSIQSFSIQKTISDTQIESSFEINTSCYAQYLQETLETGFTVVDCETLVDTLDNGFEITYLFSYRGNLMDTELIFGYKGESCSLFLEGITYSANPTQENVCEEQHKHDEFANCWRPLYFQANDDYKSQTSSLEKKIYPDLYSLKLPFLTKD